MTSHYAELLSLYRFRILLSGIVAGLIALALSLVILMSSPSYTATVTMNMKPSEEALLFNREFMGVSQFNPATIITQTHIERLLSEPVANRAIETLLAELGNGTIGDATPSMAGRIKGWLWRTWTRLNFGGFVEASPERQLLAEFRDSIDIETVEGSYILLVEASHSYPTVAAAIANVLAETYIDLASEESSLESERAASVLRRQVESREAVLAELFERRRLLREEYDIADLGRQASLTLTSIEALQTRLSDDELERNLKQNEIVRLQSETGTRSSQASGLLQDLEDEMSVLDDRIAFRESQIAEQSAKLSFLSNRETEFVNIANEVEASRQNLFALREQLSTFELGVQSLANQIQIIAPATIPLYPSSPKVLVNTIAAVIVGALIAFMIAVVQDIFGSRIRTSSDLAAAVGNRALPSGQSRMLVKRSFLGLKSFRMNLRLQRFIEAFGQKMSVETDWAGSGIAVTGYVDQEKLIEVRNFLGEIVKRSVYRPGGTDAFRVTAIGPVHSVKDWNSIGDAIVVVVCAPDQKFDYDLAGLKTLGSDPVRQPLFMVWRD